MRSSSRAEILDAALRVVNAEGSADITYGSVAREAGLTKAGLMYHFATRDLLMVAIIEHVLERWQAELQAELGTRLEHSTLEDRVRAFVTFAGECSPTRGDFVVFSEAVRRPELSAPWERYLRDWFGFGGRVTSLLLVWLASNGLWIAEATGTLTLTDDQRLELVNCLFDMAKAGAK